MIILVLLITLVGIVYMAPTIVAFRRGHSKRGEILALNLFFGWTVLGWAGLLVWACSNQSKLVGFRHLQETFR